MLLFQRWCKFTKKLLIVEDDKDIQEFLPSFLVNEGYEVTIASDGVEAITKFPNHNFDLILLAVMLPEINGYGVCEFVRKSSNAPIIMLSALS
ncbi:MAG: response regulator [Clostridiales bacterium]|nr:response regulator [Clostridiales bacterium]